MPPEDDGYDGFLQPVFHSGAGLDLSKKKPASARRNALNSLNCWPEAFLPGVLFFTQARKGMVK